MKKLLLVFIVALGFAGCAGDSLTVAKCDKYENGVCINAQTVKMHECKEPLVQDGKTFCK